ncbi:carboxypeptidase-like protein [Lutibacter sp. Hel_I_33_5]|uniref:carboxypeptidase-like regulatory domain-containing protein n=1 Tax=Lutibacter sp. Hel_I_33_5 TaxID=1566289 RepID=UPI00119CF8C1|nr:carboxypeptidase-like regulatory domain-containing protein [Lutibacter sp. Hel_I_33_5]TVZ56061.1 carboxypeptidase-like protein [Lutibacter sp. Hel_I_33_5]
MSSRRAIPLFLLCFLFANLLSAKEIIKGFVVNQNRSAAENVTVYLNYTSVHTTTNANGYFELAADEGNYDLIISSVGYTTIKHKLKITKYNSALTFILVQKGLASKNTNYNKVWEHHFEEFKHVFLGTSEVSKGCTIKNPKSLYFTFDVNTGTLIAKSTEPILIENKSLGYLVSYDLQHFLYSPSRVSYDGYLHFLEMNTLESNTKKWIDNRLKAYNGSRMHFVRALLKQELEEEGFFIYQFRKIPNKDRPTEESIKKARNIVTDNYNSPNLNPKVKRPRTALDSAVVTLRKISLPKYKEVLYKKFVPYGSMTKEYNNETFINFKDYLKVIYTKEGEEKAYLQASQLKKTREAGYQITNLDLLSKATVLDKSGMLLDPLDLLVEGYWAFKRIADMLPIDYQPPVKTMN